MNQDYVLNDKNYSNIFELGEDIYLHPHEFYQAFKSDPSILEFIKSRDNEKYQAILDLMADRYIPDAFLFHAAMILNPHQPLSYHKYRFASYKDLGKMIIGFAPKIDIYLLDLLSFGFVKEYMIMQKDDTKCPQLFEKISALTDACRTNKNLSYFQLGFFLYGTDNITYEHRLYKNLDAFLIEYLNTPGLIRLAQNFNNDYFIQAWSIETQGNDILYKRYKKIVELLQEKEELLNKEKAFYD